jgi:hypothetical protein
MSRQCKFCPQCGVPQRAKVVEYFNGDVGHGDGGLRVSMYLAPPQHIRFSIWEGNSVKATISLQPSEARRLGDVLGRLRHAQPHRMQQLRLATRVLADALAQSPRRSADGASGR